MHENYVRAIFVVTQFASVEAIFFTGRNEILSYNKCLCLGLQYKMKHENVICKIQFLTTTEQSGLSDIGFML